MFLFIFQAEINNFRESFERGEDPLADMTDGNDNVKMKVMT